MNITGLLFLIVTQFVCGRGLIQLFKLQLKPVAYFGLANLTGVLLFSFLPFILQLFYIPITYRSVLASICTLTFMLSINQVWVLLRNGLHFKIPKWTIRLYELPFICTFYVLAYTSVWRCYWYLANARDILSGPETIAEYTVKEKTMLNSVFSVNLETTNNHLKPPFVTCLQIIYKLFVQPYGQTWLSILFLSFTIWLYSILRDKVHPVIAGLLILFFTCMPELYGHTSLILFDYSNMIFFFAGFYFVAQWANNKQWMTFAFAALMFGFATYIRTDTLLLVTMVVPLIMYFLYKEHVSIGKSIIALGIFISISFFFYFIWMNVFLKYYMPVHFDVSQQINNNLRDLSPFFDRISAMIGRLFTGELSIRLFGYFLVLFYILLPVDVIFFRKKYKKEAIISLYGIALVFIGMALMGYLIPWVDLLNTTKRGIFKMFPLILLYEANSPLLLWITSKVKEWEYASKAAVTNFQPAVANGKQQIPMPGKKSMANNDNKGKKR